ncbi:MAG: hypothetical protein A2687_05870 [Candidatus Levybacteria bacterium RIFCSPHIGHO2_01_FULL_38_26]|nr:MAG: hypothetical protein A2687_05870 [Candidatus Levybacteria bacterium RIFCSPHIGHO2_01_FULL_38_26]
MLRDDKQLAKEFGISPSTIFRYRKELIALGLLFEENGLTKITNFRTFELECVKKIAKVPYLSPEDLYLTPQEDFSDIESSIANLQERRDQKGYKASHSKGSSKGNTSKDSLWLDDKEEFEK